MPRCFALLLKISAGRFTCYWLFVFLVPTGQRPVAGPACTTALPALADNDSDLLTRSTLTGDWGGLRHQMDEDGVKFTGDYSGETAYNADGGLHRSARYSQNIKLGVQFDLSKLYGVDNAGKIQLTINDRRGNSASEDLVGNRLPIQENYGGLYTRLTELSYERSLFTPALNVKLGYMAMGNDLGGLDSGILCNFMNAGFCGHPLNMSGGSGWTNYPNAHLGVRVKYDLSPSWQLRVAAFNVDPESNGNSSRAWHLGPKHTTGTVVPIELVYKHAGDLPGEYKVGYYYDSSDVKRIGSDKEVSGRGGHYLLVDQAVWRSRVVRRPQPACLRPILGGQRSGLAVQQVVRHRRGSVQTVRRSPA